MFYTLYEPLVELIAIFDAFVQCYVPELNILHPRDFTHFLVLDSISLSSDWLIVLALFIGL